MNNIYQDRQKRLLEKPRTWLITGVAGFIGSNLLERLLKLNQSVVGLDNFYTGSKKNLDEVKNLVTKSQWERFRFIEGDIRDIAACQTACRGVHYVMHHAALGSVSRSIEDPVTTNDVNITGTLNVFVAARDNKVNRLVYAASSSTYGDHPGLPKVESLIGKPLSPYAVTKYVNELYADIFGRCYGIETIGLRYFNVFGPRQDPKGPYAAVIPKWIAAMIKNEPVYINGNGDTSRDFCYVENAIQANVLAASSDNPDAVNQVYNIALNSRASLNELFELLRTRLAVHYQHLQDYRPVYGDFRVGDIMHSLADINKAKQLLGYQPTHTIVQGLDAALAWYKANTSLQR